MFIFVGCNQTLSESPQKTYGEDAHYYIALRKLASGNEKEAIQLLARCAEKGSYYIARRSAEELTKLGNVQDKLAASKKLIEKYGDEDALLIAMRQYEAAEEYTQIIVMTEALNLAKCDSELGRIRLAALFKTNSAQFEDVAYKWYTTRAMTAHMYKLYQDTMSTTERNYREKIINFRVDVYRRSYRAAYERIDEVNELIAADQTLSLTAQLVSDMGKACLYGSENNIRNARMFSEIATVAHEDKKILYNAWFYAGRLYDRVESSYAASSTRFINAMDNAQTGEQYDDALWYLLSSSLRASIDVTINLLEKYFIKIYDPSNFDNFFESFVPLLLSQARWSDFKRIYELIDGYASDNVTAKFAYIYGRLVQEGFAYPSNPEKETEKAFTRALKSGTDIYYKTLAAMRLNFDETAVEQLISDVSINNNFKQNADAERLLIGYALFGLPERIYSEWLSFTTDKNIAISLDCAVQLSDFLNKTATYTDNYYTQSLRIIARAASRSDKPLTSEALKLLYPRNYSEDVEAICKKFSLSPEMMYALIRTESFFAHDVVSSAGAVGLTQLMEFTASDIAQRLKQKEYSLHDPITNIEFGAYYLASLIKYFDGSALTAFFAYNGGLTRVKRWLRNFRIEFGKEASSAYDLFLETVPYAETRDYGRKLVAASVVYGNVHFNKSIQTVAKSIMVQ